MRGTIPNWSLMKTICLMIFMSLPIRVKISIRVRQRLRAQIHFSLMNYCLIFSTLSLTLNRVSTVRSNWSWSCVSQYSCSASMGIISSLWMYVSPQTISPSVFLLTVHGCEHSGDGTYISVWLWGRRGEDLTYSDLFAIVWMMIWCIDIHLESYHTLINNIIYQK